MLCTILICIHVNLYIIGAFLLSLVAKFKKSAPLSLFCSTAMCIDGWEQRPSLSFFRLIAAIVLSLFFLFSLDCYALYVYAQLRKRRKQRASMFATPACLPLLFLERARVSTVFLHRGDRSRESIIMFVSLLYTERGRRGLKWESKRELYC